MIIKETMNLIKNLYEDLDKLVNLIGLEYEYESDEYVCRNAKEVSEKWCDDDMLRSIENAHADIGFFLGK